LYNELALRHYQSIKRPSVRDRIEGWHAYRRLFDFILEEAPPKSSKGGEPPNHRETLYLIPEWCFDILHEFLYQFQGFCQFRTTTYTAATKAVSASSAAAAGGDGGATTEEDILSLSSSSSSPLLPAHIADAIEALNQNRDAWAVESVLFYLHRLVSVGSSTMTTSSSLSQSSTKNVVVSPTYRYLAYFSSVTLSRLECLLGDYRSSIAALDVIYNPHAELIAVGGGGGGGGGEDSNMKSPEELVNSVFPARLSLTYHAGVSYLMLRRYKDATSILGGICLFMQRGFKVSYCRKANQHFSLSLLLTDSVLTIECPAESDWSTS
jgi:translation initiation factor 3 subunit L